ncbi:hypothetical protein Tco_0076542, partial [Tanacetum coccineum]
MAWSGIRLEDLRIVTPGAAPVARAPYRLAPSEMKEFPWSKKIAIVFNNMKRVLRKDVGQGNKEWLGLNAGWMYIDQV